MRTSPGIKPQSCRRHSKQSGQAIVLILLLTLAGLVGGVALYSTGVLTSEKIQLQNAADATAYSVSVIEARDLNFTAYMNRAMIANEVAIGQMVSMMSWAYMTRSMPDFVDDYAAKIDLPICIVTLGASCKSIQGAVTPVTRPMRQLASKVFTVVKTFTKPVAKGLTILNQMYSLSQQGFHLLSFLFSASTLFDVKERNIDGSEYSAFGAVALARHFTSYYAGLVTSSLYGFVQGYSQGNPGDAAGVTRLAQVINDSRDGFTKNRECNSSTTDITGTIPPITVPKISIGPIYLGPIVTTFATPGVDCYPTPVAPDDVGGWLATLFGLDVSFTAGGDFEIAEGSFSVDVYFNVGISRQGGTDLRQGDDNEYSWSAADTTEPDLRAGITLEACLYVLGIGGCEDVEVNIDPPAPPFGVGAAIAGDPEKLDLSGIPSSGEPREIMYGRASDNLLAWDFVIPPFPIPPVTYVPMPSVYDHMRSVRSQMQSSSRQVNPSYKLNRYQDTEDRPEITSRVGNDWISGMEASYLLIGLIKEDVVANSQLSGGVFELDAPATGIASLFLGPTVRAGVIAKSEVYYTRPSDPLVRNYFKRGDNREEKSNAFNPYWQARLVDTSYIDRVSALAFQHGQASLPSGADAVILQAMNLLDKIKSNAGNIVP